MNYTGLSTKLKLAYAPLSNHDFTIIKSEKIIREILKGCMLYVIAKRPLMTFQNVNFSEVESILFFEIHKQGTDKVLKCSLPLYQKNIGMTKLMELM